MVRNLFHGWVAEDRQESPEFAGFSVPAEQVVKWRRVNEYVKGELLYISARFTLTDGREGFAGSTGWGIYRDGAPSENFIEIAGQRIYGRDGWATIEAVLQATEV